MAVVPSPAVRESVSDGDAKSCWRATERQRERNRERAHGYHGRRGFITQWATNYDGLAVNGKCPYLVGRHCLVQNRCSSQLNTLTNIARRQQGKKHRV